MPRSMPITIPDISGVEEYWSQNHAIYDADLVRFLDEESNWGRANLEADPEIGFEHVREFSRRRLVEYLRTVPDLATQDLSDQRLVLHHIAHVASTMSGILLHANGHTEERWLQEFRQSLHFIAQQKKMVVRSESDPIASHWKKKTELFTIDGVPQHLSVLQGTEKDAAVAWHFLGNCSSPIMNISHTRERIMQAMPFLADADTTYIDRRLEDLRKDILAVFEGRSMVYAYDTKRAMKLLVDHWVEKGPGANSDEVLDALIEEIYFDGNMEEEPLDLTNDPIDRILRLGFDKFLGEGASPLDEDGRIALEDRRLLLEFLLMREAETAEGDTMPSIKKIAAVYQKYHGALGLRFGDMGHLDLAIMLIGADTLPQLRSMLH